MTARSGRAKGAWAQPQAWPLLMDLATACAFLGYTRAQFRALVAAGLLPPPREPVPGKPQWHRVEVELATARV
jgi:hypothetical protein